MPEAAVIRSATPADAAAIRATLAACSLDAGGVPDDPAEFLVAEEQGVLVGVVGLERYGRVGLLRSAAVLPGRRSAGTGRRLVEALEARAADLGIGELFLLTTTAEEFFAARGYARVEREAVTGPVRASGQFLGMCPSTAAVMRKVLGAA